jgi:dynein intermediate chain 2
MKYDYSDGAVYGGEWKNDEYHGQGTLKESDGKIYKGIWKNGKLIK